MPAHLLLRPERRKPNGKLKERAYWAIRDGSHEESTGCGAGNRVGAEQKLRDYLARKHVSSLRERDPAAIPVADVLALYARDKATKHARPHETAQRLGVLLDFFGNDMLSDINGERCRAFADQCATAASARRCLEDLRSAINHHRREGKCTQIISVVLPPENPSRERWLTRAEAAALLWHCWRQPTLKHVARFILVGLYTGTRASAICGAALQPTPRHGWVDLKNGVFYRRPPRTAQTKKRQPAIRLPSGLLSHLRRWKAHGQRFVVEWHGQPVKRVTKAFDRAVIGAGLDGEVIPHVLRHTAITWAMQRKADPWEVAGYFGISMEMLLERYGHHHPDHQTTVHMDRPTRRTG